MLWYCAHTPEKNGFLCVVCFQIMTKNRNKNSECDLGFAYKQIQRNGRRIERGHISCSAVVLISIKVLDTSVCRCYNRR